MLVEDGKVVTYVLLVEDGKVVTYVVDIMGLSMERNFELMYDVNNISISDGSGTRNLGFRLGFGRSVRREMCFR